MIEKSGLIALWAELFDSYGDQLRTQRAMINFHQKIAIESAIALVGLNAEGVVQLIDEAQSQYGIGEFESFCESWSIYFNFEESWNKFFEIGKSGQVPFKAFESAFKRFAPEHNIEFRGLAGLKTLLVDNEGEYLQEDLAKFCEAYGITLNEEATANIGSGVRAFAPSF